MKQKTALYLSVALTAFVLVVLGSLVSGASGFVGVLQGLNSDPSVEQVVIQREQEYLQAINDANQRITEMQAQIDGANLPGEVAISAEDATAIALEAAMPGYSLIGEAELVEYEGQLAYEVPFNDGLIYVDAVSGAVLFNGTIVYGPAMIGASAAARIASEYMKRQDVVKVSFAVLNGQEVFRVVFSGNDIVYVSQYGVLLQVQLANTGVASAGSHQEDDDHEDDHDEDHGDNND